MPFSEVSNLFRANLKYASNDVLMLPFINYSQRMFWFVFHILH